MFNEELHMHNKRFWAKMQKEYVTTKLPYLSIDCGDSDFTIESAFFGKLDSHDYKNSVFLTVESQDGICEIALEKHQMTDLITYLLEIRALMT